MGKDIAAQLQSVLESYADALPFQDGGLDALTVASLSQEVSQLWLAECEQYLGSLHMAQPLRTLHHFACTGGTLIAKSIALMPNVALLSEVDPLSNIVLPKSRLTKPVFNPTDLIYGLRRALRPADESVVLSLFQAGLGAAHRDLSLLGQMLVVRDHTHSQFCTSTDWNDRPTLREILIDTLPVCSVVIVRHPLDSYLSLRANGWVNFSPGTLDTYAVRYLAFLDRYTDVPIVKYEDFVADYDSIMRRLCSILQLPFVSGAQELLPLVSISGDSGRSSNKIEPRARRSYASSILTEAHESKSFGDLCERLDYELPSI